MNKIKDRIWKKIFILSKEEKQEFINYFPNKVYLTERNISVVVALTQVAMIILFLSNKHLDLSNFRTVAYLSLYIYLLIVTIGAVFLYSYAYRTKQYKLLNWLRRVCCFLICIWLMGITFLGQMKGNDLSVFSYLLPTMAAVLLLSPLESLIIFSSTWVMLVTMILVFGSHEGLFGILINSIFVTVLSIYISFRYYRSIAIEFLDRKIIEKQYEEIKQTNQKLEEIAHVDQLTGLYNRHYLHQKVYPMFNEYICEDNYSMCLLLDIDFFKQYNDTYGHLQGDECIKSITRVIKDFCDKYDANAVRYGGEEFLIVKVGKEKFDANQIADELLQSIRDLQIPRNDSDLGYVTVSIGLWHNGLFCVSSLENAILYADNAVYYAKDNGKNCIYEAKQK